MTDPQVEIAQLRQEIAEDRAAYYAGTPRVSDDVFDAKVERLEQLSPNDEVLDEVGTEVVNENRKRTLDHPMRSMHKCKTLEEIYKWLRKYGLPLNTLFVASPKLDGMSNLHNEDNKQATSRGNGTVGQENDAHIKLVNGFVAERRPILTIGEIIMPNANFAKYAEEGDANPRNTVGGFLGNDKPVESELRDCSFIRYGLVSNEHDFATKHEVFDYLNSFQPIPIHYELLRADEVTEEGLKALFTKWSTEYALDGIILEVDDMVVQRQLGRERNGNPAYARAYKGGDLEEKGTSPVTGLTFKTSKQGLAVPTIQISPLKLDGVTVTNITGNNARYLVDMGIDVGVEVVVKRSGMVIPQIVSVVNPKENPELPKTCSCGSELVWNENKVHLVCESVVCPSQALMRIISFFSILEVENVSEGVLTQFYEAGYDTIEKILRLTPADMEKLDRFGKRKAEISYNAIQAKLTDIPLAKLQHASGFFRILGSKKLALLQHFTEKPSVEAVCKLNGFSEKSAKSYIEGWDKFYEFVKDLPLTYKAIEKKVVVGGSLSGTSFVFTGVRRKDLEELITNGGGSIGGSVSKTTTHLVVKAKGSGSSKEVKAQSLGIPILTEAEAEALIKG